VRLDMEVIKRADSIGQCSTRHIATVTIHALV
jgi:hypothetical protein